MQKTDQRFKPHGRLAHEGHKSKVGTAWKSDFVQVIVQDPMTKSFKLLPMARGNVSCKKCNAVIEYDTRGIAFCQCSDANVWNDGIQKRHSYLDRDFLKGLKFHSAAPGTV
jgi:hypothetical protein